jgi:hypothetical protein
MDAIIKQAGVTYVQEQSAQNSLTVCRTT